MNQGSDALKDWVTQLRKGLLEFCVLRVLGGGEQYGYEIVQRLRKMDALSITESTVYPILGRLKSEGFLKVRTSPSPEGPPRRYFSLTETGRGHLREMRDYWNVFTRAIETL